MNAHFTVIEILLDVTYAHNDAIQSQIHTLKETDAHTMLNMNPPECQNRVARFEQLAPIFRQIDIFHFEFRNEKYSEHFQSRSHQY